MRVALPILVAAIVVGSFTATQPAAAQEVSVRPLGPIVESSSRAFGSVSQVVALSDGRVLVNDPARRQVVLLDPNLRNATVVFDSTAGGDYSYGSSAGTLLPFLGDSALFFERTGNVFLVLDQHGRIGRTMSRPPATGLLAQVPLTIMFSRSLGIVYNLPVFPFTAFPRPPGLRVAPGEPTVIITYVDTSFVLSMNVATRAIDTLARAGTGRLGVRSFRTNGEGGVTEQASFPFIDVPVVVTDGSLAIFRAHEYRLEWIGADGSKSLSPRLPYDWRRIAEDEKPRLLDSINATRLQAFDTLLTAWLRDSADGTLPVLRIVALSPGGPPVPIRRAKPVPPRIVDLSEIPDYFPPTGVNAVFADAENRVWIAPASVDPRGGDRGVVYDILDRNTTLAARVSVPYGRSIVGFSPGHVFLMTWDAGEARLIKARIE